MAKPDTQSTGKHHKTIQNVAQNVAANRPSSGNGDMAMAVSVPQASRMLGMDARTVRRMCAEGRLESFSSPGGQLRVTVASVENILSGDSRHGNADTKTVQSVSSSPLTQNRKQTTDELKALIEEKRTRLALQELEDRERERDEERAAARRAQEEQVRREERERASARATREREQQQALDAARNKKLRERWEAGWVQTVMSRLPADCPPDVQRDVLTAVRADLKKFYGHPDQVVGLTLDATVQGVLAGWLRGKQAAADTARAMDETSDAFYVRGLFGNWELQKRAQAAAKQAIMADPNGTYEEKRAAGQKAAQDVVEEHQEREREKQEQQARERAQLQREREVDGFLNLFTILSQLQKCVTDFGRETPLACAERCKAAIRPQLLADSSVAFWNADERVRGLVDRWVDAQTQEQDEEPEPDEESDDDEERDGEEEESGRGRRAESNGD